MRVLCWKGTDDQLLQALRRFARRNIQLKFRRILVLPYPLPPVGFRLDLKLYAK